MILKLCYICFFFFSFSILSGELKLYDDLYPIEGASKILYSYEFGDAPYFLERLNQDIFLIMTLDGNDIELYEYNLSKDTIIMKMEFECDSDESIENYLIKGNELLLFTTYSTKESIIGKGTTGFLDKLIIINLDRYEVKDCRYVFSNYNIEDFEYTNWENDCEFCSDTVNEDAFTVDFEKLDIIPNEYREIRTTYNKDSTIKNYLGLVYSKADKTRYIYSGNLDLNTLKNTSSINKFEDNNGWMNINYIHLDEKANVYFLGEQYNDKNKSRVLIASKITPEGVMTSSIKDISHIKNENWITHGTFEQLKNENNKLSLFGYTKHGEVDKWYKDPNASFILIGLNLKTLEIEYKEKNISIDEGKKLNNNDYELRFNNISKVMETKDGFILLTETYEAIGSTRSYNYTTNQLFYAFLEDINLISMDRDLNIKWNKHIYRDFKDLRLKMGPIRGNYIDRFNTNSLYLKPEFNENEISFTYTTTEPEDEIIRVIFDLNTGEKIYQQSIFENDGIISYFPWNHINVGNNEYVGILNKLDNYIVRYKLFKK
jgi:hypothetical protein